LGYLRGQRPTCHVHGMLGKPSRLRHGWTLPFERRGRQRSSCPHREQQRSGRQCSGRRPSSFVRGGSHKLVRICVSRCGRGRNLSAVNGVLPLPLLPSTRR
ncbi:unnamed protein product, partial [Ectocarpus sp. 13 AM-2016]